MEHPQAGFETKVSVNPAEVVGLNLTQVEVVAEMVNQCVESLVACITNIERQLPVNLVPLPLL